MYTLLNKNLCSYIYNNKIDFTNRATNFFPGNSNINEVLKFTTKIITFNYHLQIKYKKIKLSKNKYQNEANYALHYRWCRMNSKFCKESIFLQRQ